MAIRFNRARSAVLAVLMALAIPAGPSSAQFIGDGSGVVDVPGGQIHYESRGKGTPILLIHGGMVDQTMWDPQMEQLSTRLRVIRFDSRGYGESPASGPFHPADDILALLNHLQIERVGLVGLSNGGAAAVDFVLTNPERVSSLVLAEPGVAGYQFSQTVMQNGMRAAAQLREEDYPGAIQTLLNGGAFAYSRAQDGEAYRQITRMVSSNLQGFAMFPRTRWREPQAIDKLGLIKSPALVLISEYAEGEARKIVAKVLGEIPNSRSALIPDAGHMMNLDNPAAFNSVLLEFFTTSE